MSESTDAPEIAAVPPGSAAEPRTARRGTPDNPLSYDEALRLLSPSTPIDWGTQIRVIVRSLGSICYDDPEHDGEILTEGDTATYLGKYTDDSLREEGWHRVGFFRGQQAFWAPVHETMFEVVR